MGVKCPKLLPICLNVDDKKFVIGTLAPRFPQMFLKLKVPTQFKLSHKCKGLNVYVRGHSTKRANYHSESEDDESEDEAPEFEYEDGETHSEMYESEDEEMPKKTPPREETPPEPYESDDEETGHQYEEDEDTPPEMNKATTGKPGLGIKDRPKKIAGVHFEGKKTSSDDSRADSNSSPKRKRVDPETERSDEPKPKLKKLCRQLLRQVPGESLKLKQLKVLINQQSPSTFSNLASERDGLEFLKQKLEGSEKFVVDGKKVSLK